MEIKLANEKDLLFLWEETVQTMQPTTRFFYDNLKSGIAELWTWNHDNQIVGELYVFKKLPDTDFADGIHTAYLCAFRMKKEFRGAGYGTKLLERVFHHLKSIGFVSVTIGVDETETDNIRLYKRMGFSEEIKDCFIDPCNLDENQSPSSCEKFWLLQKRL